MQRPVLEMVQNQIARHKSAPRSPPFPRTARHPGQHLPHIPLDPLHPVLQPLRSRRKIHSQNLPSLARQPLQQFAAARPDLDHPSHSQPIQHSAHPAEVPHQAVDQPQIPPAPNRFRIVPCQLVQNLRLDQTIHCSRQPPNLSACPQSTSHKSFRAPSSTPPPLTSQSPNQTRSEYDSKPVLKARDAHPPRKSRHTPLHTLATPRLDASIYMRIIRHMHRTTILLPDELRRRAVREAKALGISLGELIRRRLAGAGGDARSEEVARFLARRPWDGAAPDDTAANHDLYLYGP